MQRLNDLYVRFDEATHASHADLDGGAHLTHAHRDSLEHLRHEIETAREGVKQEMANWQHKLAASTVQRIKAESYEILDQEQRAAHTAAVEKAHVIELSEILMRKWSQSEGANQ